MKKTTKTNEMTVKMYNTLTKPVITEKSMIASEAGKYIFKVASWATKEDIKKAVEAIFNVQVVKVNTISQNGKEKRFKGFVGVRSDYKKAIISLADGQTIDVTTGV